MSLNIFPSDSRGFTNLYCNWYLHPDWRCVLWLSRPHGTSNFDSQSLIYSDLNYTSLHCPPNSVIELYIDSNTCQNSYLAFQQQLQITFIGGVNKCSLVSWIINGWWHWFESVVYGRLFWFWLNQCSTAQ